jgi:hypothetical protein
MDRRPSEDRYERRSSGRDLYEEYGRERSRRSADRLDDYPSRSRLENGFYRNFLRLWLLRCVSNGQTTVNFIYRYTVGVISTVERETAENATVPTSTETLKL